MEVFEGIDKERLPQHVAIIMDGNGRWAKQRGNIRLFGHRNALKAVREAAEGCAELGIEYLTLYAFSTENWNRPKAEVDGLMTLLVETLVAETPGFMKNGIRLRVIGSRNLPSGAQAKLDECVAKTADNKGLNLVLALSYSARVEMLDAVKAIAEKVEKGDLKAEDIDDKVIADNLYTNFMPDPDLLIRTSGEYRISNFLLYQLAYTELFFSDVLWPDFRKEHLKEALLSYQGRERRFGKTSEQVKK